MQPLPAVFTALGLAHLLGDFPFQPSWLVQAKKRHWWGLCAHGAVHLVLALALLLVFAPQASVFTARGAVLTVAYAAVHLMIDAARQGLIRERLVDDSTMVFGSDQALHGASIGGLTLLLTRTGWKSVHPLASIPPSARDHILVGAAVYAAVVFAGGDLIRYLTRSLVHRPGGVGEEPEQLENAGLYIGWIERILIITAVLLRSPALIGLILTGKSIARFPEMKEPRFAEYFLIGTLLSMGIALLGGLLLLRLWYGTVSLQP